MQGVDINTLELAAQLWKPELCVKFIKQGANVNKLNRCGEPPLFLAVCMKEYIENIIVQENPNYINTAY